MQCICFRCCFSSPSILRQFCSNFFKLHLFSQTSSISDWEPGLSLSVLWKLVVCRISSLAISLSPQKKFKLCQLLGYCICDGQGEISISGWFSFLLEFSANYLIAEASCSWEVQGEVQENSKEVSLNVPPYEKNTRFKLVCYTSCCFSFGCL